MEVSHELIVITWLDEARRAVLTFLLAHRYLPVDRPGPKTDRARFDTSARYCLL